MIRVGVLDVPLLVILGGASAAVYRSHLRSRSEDGYLFLTILVVGCFWLNASAEYFWSVSYWRFGIETVRVGFEIGLPFLLSYLLWFRAAGELAFLLLGRQRDQGGLLWVFRLTDRTDPIRPSFEADDSIDEDAGP